VAGAGAGAAVKPEAGLVVPKGFAAALLAPIAGAAVCVEAFVESIPN